LQRAKLAWQMHHSAMISMYLKAWRSDEGSTVAAVFVPVNDGLKMRESSLNYGHLALNRDNMRKW